MCRKVTPCRADHLVEIMGYSARSKYPLVAATATLLQGTLSLNAFAWDTPTYGDTSIAMGDTLAFGGDDLQYTTNLIGDWSFNAALSGLGAIQSNATDNNPRNYGDISNAQVVVSKQKGTLQFFAIGGFYSIPDLSTNYVRAATQTKNTWGALPIAIATIAADQNWSLNIGNLFALGGAEGTFSYENINIQRGLLWGQTNSVSRGVQLNYVNDRWSSSVAWTDGAYSGKYNWVAFSAAYQTTARTAVTVVWNGSLSANPTNTTGTPLLQNNSQITNLLFSYKGDSLGFTPYLQYSLVPDNPTIGINGVSSTQGIGILSTYRITPLINGQMPKRNITLPFRLEYINTQGDSGTSTNNLLYGPNSAAWSATLSPTWQQGPYFARVEASFVSALNYTPGTAFGVNGITRNQARGILEAGILF